jgi:cold shock CspA family protein
MSEVMSEAILVAVKFFNGAKGFGFFSHSGEKDIFVHIEHLERFGFNPSDMTEGLPALVEYEESEKGKTVTVISKIGDKLASEPVAAKTPAAKKKWVAGKSPQVTLDMFLSAELVAGDGGWMQLYRIRNNCGEFVQYLIAEGQVVMQQCGNVTQESAKVYLDMLTEEVPATAEVDEPSLPSNEGDTTVVPIFSSRRRSAGKAA